MEAKSFTPRGNFMDLLLDAICVVDAEGRFVFVSAACERIFGYTPKEMLGRQMIEMVAPDDRQRTLQAASEIMLGNPKPHFENRYVRKDGTVVHIMWSARWSEADQLRIAVARDITDRKQAEMMQAALYAISEAAHAAEDLLALFQRIHQIIGTLLPALNFSVALTDEKSNQLSFPYYIEANEQAPASRKPATCALCAAVVHTGQSLLLTPETLPTLSEDLRSAIDADTLCWLGVPLTAQKGTIGALVLKSYTGSARYTEKDQALLQFVSTQIATAIERKQLHAKVQYRSQYDALTDLPNRALLYDRMETALARARRQGTLLSLLYLDLNKFKQVNDTLGHQAGDMLLQEIAQRLKQCVRETDTVARVGGDEFVVLLESIHEPENVSAVAEKIRNTLSQPVTLEGRSVCILPSIGVAHYPAHGGTAHQLLRHADDAMYSMKRSSDNCVRMESGSTLLGDGTRMEPTA